MSHTTKNIVIIGTDLVGTSTAYYLSQSSDLDEKRNVILVEEGEVGGGSQRYGSGLIGETQGSVEHENGSLQELTEFSLRLHSKLARKYDGLLKWGYSPIDVQRAEAGSAESRYPTSGPNSDLDPTSTTINDPISTPFAALRLASPLSSLTATSDISSTSIARSAVIDPVLLTKYLCSIFLGHPRCSLLIARATSLTFEDQPVAANGSSSSDVSSETRRVSGVNVVQKINGVEEIVHVAASSVVISTGSKLLSTSRSFLGEDAVQRLRLDERVGEETRESIVLKPREKINPLAMKVNVGSESDKELAVVVRDDGRVHIGRFIPSIHQKQSENSATTKPHTDGNASGNGHSEGNMHADELDDLLPIVEGLSPHFKSSRGTLLISRNKHKVPFLSPKSTSSTGGRQDGSGTPESGRSSAAALVGAFDGFEGVWIALNHRSDPTLGPGIGYVLAERILGVNPTTDIDLAKFKP
ncbi:hypothetical protein IAT40_001943 [Kwoniella sp. CBS 6097]